MNRGLVQQEKRGSICKDEGKFLRFVSGSRNTEENKPVKITVTWRLAKATAVAG
jgi:hypothetical protein